MPLFRSEFMASKPKAIPIIGPNKLTKVIKGGKVPSVAVNNLRKTKDVAVSSAIALCRLDMAV